MAEEERDLGWVSEFLASFFPAKLVISSRIFSRAFRLQL